MSNLKEERHCHLLYYMSWVSKRHYPLKFIIIVQKHEKAIYQFPSSLNSSCEICTAFLARTKIPQTWKYKDITLKIIQKTKQCVIPTRLLSLCVRFRPGNPLYLSFPFESTYRTVGLSASFWFCLNFLRLNFPMLNLPAHLVLQNALCRLGLLWP